MDKIDLTLYGFDDFYKNQIVNNDNENIIPARITAVHKDLYKIVTNQGDKNARLKGTYFYKADKSDEFPTVGDFVIVEINNSGDSTIIQLLNRKSEFSRSNLRGHSAEKAAHQQIIAANFDYVFILASLNHDLNLRRLERYLTATLQVVATTIVVLTKLDLCKDKSIINKVHSIAMGTNVFAVSSYTGEGMQQIKKYFSHGKTVVFLGSSGVGKSTLVNCLYGEEIMRVNSIREDDDRGRHTTTHRQLSMLPTGGMVIDTPGMRELGIWDASEGISSAFEDVDILEKMCKFSNCTHTSEPSCLVRQAIDSGELSLKRYESFLKLKKEMRYMEGKVNRQIRDEQHKSIKQIAKVLKIKSRGKWVKR